MSKIQKALDMLRDQRDAAAAVGRPGADGQVVAKRGNGHLPPAGSQESARMRRQPPDIDETSTTWEALSQDLLHVDIESLRASGLFPSDDDDDQVSQQFRRIKRPVINLAFGDNLAQEDNANVVMVASALPKSGKTWCSINLAASIARERDVGAVLVDADVLKPNISRALGLDERVGLIDHLLDPSISIDDIIVPTDFHGIVVVPAGRQHEEATELLASRRMERFVASLAERFRGRLVVVDTPPLLLTNEAHVLAEHMGQIIMVIEAGVSTQESVQQALEMLNRSKPINAILNKARGGMFTGYGAGGYGSSGAYGYYSSPRKADSNEEQEADSADA